MLKNFLTEQGREILITREPGAKGLGSKLREILLHYEGDVSSNCESFLFLADRAQHIDTIVKPAIEAGQIVLCDRHIDSTVAYQGYGRGVDIGQIKMLNNIATSGLKPDLTFIFDINIETSAKRVGKNQDRMESSGAEFFKKVREGYLNIAKEEPERVKVIDGSKSIESIKDVVISIIESKYQIRG